MIRVFLTMFFIGWGVMTKQYELMAINVAVLTIIYWALTVVAKVQLVLTKSSDKKQQADLSKILKTGTYASEVSAKLIICVAVVATYLKYEIFVAMVALIWLPILIVCLQNKIDEWTDRSILYLLKNRVQAILREAVNEYFMRNDAAVDVLNYLKDKEKELLDTNLPNTNQLKLEKLMVRAVNKVRPKKAIMLNFPDVAMVSVDADSEKELLEKTLERIKSRLELIATEPKQKFQHPKDMDDPCLTCPDKYSCEDYACGHCEESRTSSNDECNDCVSKKFCDDHGVACSEVQEEEKPSEVTNGTTEENKVLQG